MKIRSVLGSTAALIAANVLVAGVAFAPASVYAKSEKQIVTYAQCTKNCQTRFDSCKSKVGTPGASSLEGCKTGMSVCLNDICGLKASSAEATPQPETEEKK